jgi:serine/threonine-protein kinase
VGEILVAKGHLTQAQVLEIMKRQTAAISGSPVEGYILLSQIGRGAMGEIYKAVQTSMDRLVALKILSPKNVQNEKAKQRFVQEARTVARLNHPNIVQGYDVGVKNDVYYLAMEYIDGPTVGDLLRRGGAMDEKRALQIVLQVAGALEHAYRHHIIHRDIKPDNVLLTRDGLVKLCDLGLAKDFSRKDSKEATSHGTAVGTPYYISPEQARGDEKVDTRSDQYVERVQK